jgi:pyrimidine-specific ribonucleoside hydrolase
LGNVATATTRRIDRAKCPDNDRGPVVPGTTATAPAPIGTGPDCAVVTPWATSTGEAVHAVVDGGVDDALALAVLVGCGVPIAQVVATEGACSLSVTAAATARVVAALGIDAPVRLGASRPLVGVYPSGRDPFHGEDCFAGCAVLLPPSPAPELGRDPLEGPVLATGALTVVAESVAAGESLGEVLWMGGSVAVGGNMTAAAEFNAWMDPEAADRLLAAGCVSRMVPLDVTLDCGWTMGDTETLRQTSAAGRLLGTAAAALCRRDGHFVPHDAVAVVAGVRPDLFSWVTRDVRCETHGAVTTGATVVDRRPGGPGGHTLVAETVDAEAVRAAVLEAVAAIPAP